MQIRYYVLYNDGENVMPAVHSFKTEADAIDDLRRINATLNAAVGDSMEGLPERPRMYKRRINDGVTELT